MSPIHRRSGLLLTLALWVVPPSVFVWRSRIAGRYGAPAPAGASRRPWALQKEQEIRASSARQVAALANLPYIMNSADSNSRARGVVVDFRQRTSPGMNFLVPWSRGAPKAYLVGMDGRVLWKWQPDPSMIEKDNPWLEHAELLPDGSVVFTFKDLAVLKVDRNGKRVWRTPLRAHHDVWPTDDGNFWVLGRDRRIVPEIHPTLAIESDAITLLGPDGAIRRKIAILDVLKGSGYGYLLPRLAYSAIPEQTKELDVFHTNHVEPIDGRLARLSPIYARGNLLVSIRNLNVVAILDPRTEKIVWLWGPGNLTYQHDPRLLDNGHILIFDNGTQHSQLVEVDPLTDEVVWRYAPETGFFSAASGAAQRLSNGNTLVTESMKGYAFEISPSGEVVWRYANPDIRKGIRHGIIRMTRFDPDRLTFLSTAPPPSSPPGAAAESDASSD